MLKLKLQYFGQMWRCCVIGKDSDAGKDWEQEENSMRWLHGIINSWTWAWEDSRIWWRTGKPGVLQSMGSQRVSYGLVTEKPPGITIVMYLNTINTSLWMNTWSISNVVFFFPLFLILQISSNTENILKRWYAETVASQILAKDFVHQWNYRSLCDY